ncbi:MAG: glutaredoxin family protein [Pseudomonadota bacterium]
MRTVLFFALCLTALVAQAELYRSIDSQGKVHYSDQPLPQAIEAEPVHVDAAPTPDDSLPYETRRAKEAFPVTLYTGMDCVPCDAAIDFLQQRGIPYTEKHLIKQEEVEAYRKETGGLEIPSLLVGKTHLKGFLAEQWNKELDLAGYPKQAPYRPQRKAMPQ